MATEAELRQFLQEKGWAIFDQKAIEYGVQFIVTDGSTKLPVNIYKTGRIVVQGKPGEIKTAITEWANLQQAGVLPLPSAASQAQRKNRIAKYLVIPDNINNIHEIVLGLPGDTSEREIGGPAEIYRVEVRNQGERVIITQYESGTLLVQGLSGTLFDTICEVLDQYLTQSFAERATRFITGEEARATASSYLEHPEAENEAALWLLDQVNLAVLNFLYENDRRTLLAAAGVRNAFSKAQNPLPDYSVVVMPFAKPFEGFLVRLAVHLDLTSEVSIKQKASEIEVKGWLDAIRARLPDVKRYGEIYSALDAAWGCRHKAMHSDAFHPLGTLKNFSEAEQEIATILRAMSRAHRVFVEEAVRLIPVTPAVEAAPPKQDFRFENVNRDRLFQQLKTNGMRVVLQAEGRRNVWEFIDKSNLSVVAPRNPEGLVIVSGNSAAEFCQRYHLILQNIPPSLPSDGRVRIGVDESGKGDVFGPLVIAGVMVTSETELILAREGVRDSKTISDAVIQTLAPLIKKSCPHEIIVLLPPEYNLAYERNGRNLNRLLAWGHAQVISRISKREKVQRAISDQFGDEKLVVEALEKEGCQIALEQRPRAESDIAVAAASVLARDAFITSMQEYTAKAGFDIPLGASADQVKQIARSIYRRWGKRGLERIAKMHFKTIQEILAGEDR
jgi:ribonuclease HIII